MKDLAINVALWGTTAYFFGYTAATLVSLACLILFVIMFNKNAIADLLRNRKKSVYETVIAWTIITAKVYFTFTTAPIVAGVFLIVNILLAIYVQQIKNEIK
jgi:hypothetical protein